MPTASSVSGDATAWVDVTFMPQCHLKLQGLEVIGDVCFGLTTHSLTRPLFEAIEFFVDIHLAGRSHYRGKTREKGVKEEVGKVGDGMCEEVLLIYVAGKRCGGPNEGVMKHAERV